MRPCVCRPVLAPYSSRTPSCLGRVIAEVRPPSSSCQITANGRISKIGDQWSRIPHSPPSPDFGDDFVAILLHLVDESAGSCCRLVPRSPNEQLQEHRRQIDPFLGQPVVQSSSIRCFILCGD